MDKAKFTDFATLKRQGMVKVNRTGVEDVVELFGGQGGLVARVSPKEVITHGGANGRAQFVKVDCFSLGNSHDYVHPDVDKGYRAAVFLVRDSTREHGAYMIMNLRMEQQNHTTV